MAPTVLICEDREVMRGLLRATLSGRDYAVVEARDGDESLELARAVRPDLIVLDLVMPGRSGLDVLEALRLDPVFAATPVILCTASRTFDPGVANDLGADRYLPKPFSPLELVAAVDELLTAA